ncbi:4-hydroxy-tetrahydrodipicolinate reductase [Chryseomicrobium palamuruense]|uniref:4-hydroxy-tetrahydrodipicolinate reductase n=1 Tax=Chryseomicrobium palamuruense TaxID=682973 RepID=A0ABV8UTF3_9BACL
MIRVAIAGPRGNMGKEAVKMVMMSSNFDLIAVLDSKETMIPFSCPVFTDLDQLITECQPDVLVDLTSPELGMKHTTLALENKVHAVVGTTGFSERDLEKLKNLCEHHQVGCIIAPNFSIGAVLMMKFAEQAARYMSDVEIIEMHHDRKLDAPSGTALKTAEMIGTLREPHQQGHPDEKETHPGARGASLDGIRLHSVRLPGLVAHQQVLFGGNGQLLTLRHDSFNRESFMPGVALCIEEVMKRNTFIYGLEHLID